MAININTTRSLRRPLDLVALVEAVDQALPVDESWWIEWKSDLNLRSPEGQFKAARAILSFANRMPDTASVVCEGLAYLIVGAEPQNVAGTDSIDAADLEQGLIKYLGGDGPTWSPHYVTVHGKNVLVIIVEAPKWGDPIHTLRKAYDKSFEGMVFYRSQAISRPANSAEMGLLSDRLKRGVEDPELDRLQVDYSVTPPEGLIVIDAPPGMVDEWISTRRTAVMNGQKAKVEAENSGKIMHFTTVDVEAIERYLDVCRERLSDVQRRIMIGAKRSMLKLSITNYGHRTLEDVELTLRIDGPWSAFESDRNPVGLLAFPDAPKPRSLLPKGNWGLTSGDSFSIPPLPRIEISDPNIEIDDTAITLAVGRVRPEKTALATPFHLFLHQAPQDAEPLTISWTLTSPSASGVQRGSLEIPVNPARGIFIDPNVYSE